MASHYETLGVRPDASPGEIKHAYRRKASKAHSDKGGSHDSMVAINAAYACLSDESRRQRYDATGDDSQRFIDREARAVLVKLFGELIEKGEPGDFVAQVRTALAEGRTTLHRVLQRAELQLRKLEKLEGLVEKRGGENLYAQLLAEQRRKKSHEIAQLREQLEVGALAETMLEEYRSTYVAPPPSPIDDRLTASALKFHRYFAGESWT